MIVPSRENSITACERPIASILPSRSAYSAFCFEMSVANFTTLVRLAAAAQQRIVGSFDPDFLAAFSDPLVLRGLELAAIELGQNSRYSAVAA